MLLTGASLTPAQRRKDRLREQIISAATEIYLENGGGDAGFDATTIEAIAARSDISVRTFFRYFDSKVDVIFLDIKRAIADLKHLVEARLHEEGAIAALMHASMEQLRWFLSDPLNRSRAMRSFLAPQFAERIAIWREQERRELAQLVEPYLQERANGERHARMIVGTIRTIFHDGLDVWCSSPESNAENLIQTAFAALPDVTAEIVGASFFNRPSDIPTQPALRATAAKSAGDPGGKQSRAKAVRP